MDIQFYGGNCITLTVQGARIVIDDNLSEIGAKSITKAGDVALFTGAHKRNTTDVKLVIDSPGEFEISSVSIYGIPIRAHMDEDKQQTSGTMYKFVWGDVSMLVTGHIYPDLSDRELERIGMVDVLIIPVGGNGFTLDPIGALSVIKKIEPKIVIPTHYDDQSLQFPVPQQTLEQALSSLGMEPTVTTSKLKLKASDITDSMQLIVLERA
jgi:L-ascorbate metabolism protein UlaG (beta-lactamase superfamily)